MPRKFDVNRIDILENEGRIKSINPSAIFREIDIGLGMKVADVGCGTGVFSVMLSALVGLKGKVYAVDINPGMLAKLKEKIIKDKISNVKPVFSTEECIPLPDISVDKALIIDTLHELYGETTLREIYRILKRKGTLTIIEWKKTKTEMGPPISERIPTSEALRILRKIGFKPIQISEAGSEHYLIISTKSSGERI